MVEALRYKSEGRGFDSRWCHWNFSLTYFFRPHCGPGVDSASNRNEYQEYFLRFKGGRWVGLTTIPTSCADCLAIWEPQPPGVLRACTGLYWDFCTFTISAFVCILKQINFKSYITVFWNTKPSSFVRTYQSLGGNFCLPSSWLIVTLNMFVSGLSESLVHISRNSPCHIKNSAL